MRLFLAVSAVCLASSAFALQAHILLGRQPSSGAKNAADEVRHYLQRITGQRVPVVREPEAGEGLCVIIGDSERAQSLGFDSAALAPEQIRVKTGDGWVVIMGGDAGPGGRNLNGTYWAALEFLERIGVRWLWPGPLGEVLPPGPELSIPQIDVDFTPRIIQRNIRNLYYSDRVQAGLDKLGFTREQFEAVHRDGEAWFRRQRIGTQGKFNYGHAFGHWWDEFHEEHPDWFALQPNSTRDQGNIGDRARLCVSNPEVIAQAAKEAIAKLEADPTLFCASISPNDGGRATFCLCENCRALDPPEAPLVKVWHPSDPNFMVPSLTDRYVHFYSEVAKIVAERFPDRYLGAYAYSAYRMPPLRERLHPNVFIGFVGLTYTREADRQAQRADWDAWTRSASRFFLRPNLLMDGMGFPALYCHRLVDDLKHCFDTGMRVTDFDCCYQHWALKGLNYYVLARFLWDPEIDVDRVIEDYCRAGWGPAWEPVREYFGQLERIIDNLALENRYDGRKGDMTILPSCYPDSVLSELQGHLDRARSLAAGDETILQRIDFLQTGLDFTRLNRDRRMALGLLRAGKGDQQTYEKAHAALEAYYQKMGITWAVNSPWMKFYGF
ncbi:MAG: DUF4838 domain-containing protein [Armatimonadetes bacterium]|nr:DUF4838 domain-containing protein [Armatimonadota bacterium]